MPDSFDFSSRTPPIKWPVRAVNRDGTPQQTNVGPGESDQWLRKITLSISSSSSAAGDVLNFTPESTAGSQAPDIRVVFQVRKATNQSPNMLNARIYNLAPATMQKAVEFRRVELAAGYQHGRFGTIFKGTIVQFRRGKENPVDTYLELIAGDGDLAYGFDSVTMQWDAGTKNEQIIKDVAGKFKGMNQEISVGQILAGDYGNQQILRNYSVNGMISNILRKHANGANADWFIDDGKVNFVVRSKYLPGEAAVLKPTTGLVGMPEVTPQGIQARCLLNPQLVLGGLVKIETDRLSGVPYLPGSTSGQPASPDEVPGGTIISPAAWQQQFSSAFTSPTGTYKIILLEHNGDTRGNPWYSDMVCVALDTSGNFIKSNDLPFARIHGSVGLEAPG